MRITREQHVKLRPVLPALNEIRITDVDGSERICSRFASRASGRIEPSSRIGWVGMRTSDSVTSYHLSRSGTLTADKLVFVLVQERLDEI